MIVEENKHIASEWRVARSAGGVLRALAAIMTAWMCIPLVLSGCSCGPKAIAVLEGFDGDVQRDFDQRRLNWQQAAKGDEFLLGDGLQTQSESEARLEMDDGSRIRVAPDSIVRFLEQPGQLRALGLELGAADIEATGVFVIHTAFGVATLQPGARLRVRTNEDSLSVMLSVGEAHLVDATGQRREIEQDVEVWLGEAGLVEGSLPARRGGDETPKDADELDVDFGDAVMVLDVTVGEAEYRESAQTAWQLVSSGTRVPLGGEIRGLKDAQVTLARDSAQGRSVLILEEGWVRVVSGEAMVEPLDGRVRIDRSDADVVMRVPGGAIRARGGEQGARGHLDFSSDGIEVHIEQGELILERAEQARSLRDGERLKVDPVTRYGSGPEQVVFVAPAGQSFTVHEAVVPALVGLRAPASCQEGAVVRVQQTSRPAQWYLGEQEVHVALDVGTHRYALHCLRGGMHVKRPASRGSIRVMKDDGRRPLPRTPPTTPVKADGRTYRVQYQNLLPEVVFTWPSAPKGPYSIEWRSPAETKTIPAARASHHFASGELAEGSHRLTFKSASGGRSRPTSVIVAYDNRATMATLSRPNSPFSYGEVQVSGTAAPRWRVSVGEQAMPVDQFGRFSGEVAVRAPRLGLAVKFQRAGQGVHYFARRLSGIASP